MNTCLRRFWNSSHVSCCCDLAGSFLCTPVLSFGFFCIFLDTSLIFVEGFKKPLEFWITNFRFQVHLTWSFACFKTTNTNFTLPVHGQMCAYIPDTHSDPSVEWRVCACVRVWRRTWIGFQHWVLCMNGWPVCISTTILWLFFAATSVSVFSSPVSPSPLLFFLCV